MKYAFLMIIVMAILIYWILSIGSNRVCEKSYSEEFKQTQMYKDMKCN